MIITVGGIKGGVGKSMVSVNLAVMRSSLGKKVLLVDADDQKTSSNWSDLRTSLGIKTPFTTIRLSSKSVQTEVLKLATNYDDIIIDCGGRDTQSLRAALMVSDKFIVPFQPRSFDIWTLSDVDELIAAAKSFNQKLTANAFINCAKPRGSDNDAAKSILAEAASLTLLPVTLGQRNAFSNATAKGLGIMETNEDIKAKNEFKALHNAIYTA